MLINIIPTVTQSRFYQERLCANRAFPAMALVFVFFITSCSDTEEKLKVKRGDHNEVRTFMELEPVLMEADSAEFLFYDDSVEDSLRYARYYQFMSTSDSAVLAMIRSHWKQKPAGTDTLRACRSQGKIQLLGNGEPVKTIYYADEGGTCTYLYIIKDGRFYYMEMGDSLKVYLKETRKNLSSNLSKKINPV